MVTRGHRRIGRTIRILEASVELSAKECKAKKSEDLYKEKICKTQDEQPVQSLKEISRNLREKTPSE
jgi:hypothetical protein